MSRNKKHYIPFFVLLFLHFSLLIYTFYKRKDRKLLFITLLSGMGLCFIFEYFILSLFKAYRYKPRLFQNKDLDNFFGAIMSQAVFVPFTAIFLTAFKTGWKGKILFAMFFGLVEKLFLLMGIHKNNWWRTRYTVTLIPLFFYIIDLWYQQLRLGTPFFHFSSLFLGILVNGLNLMYSLSIFRKFKFGIERWHSWEEHFKIAPIYSFLLSSATAFIIKYNSGWRGIFLSYGFTQVMDMLVMKTGIAKQKFRHFVINNLIHFTMIFWAVLLKKLIYKDFRKQKETTNAQETKRAGT